MPAHFTYSRNHGLLLDILRKEAARGTTDGRDAITMRLERILVDRESDTTVPFDGPRGLEAVLKRMSAQWPPFVQRVFDGRLTGLAGGLVLADETVPLVVTLGAGGQFTCIVGPVHSLANVLAAIDEIDRQVHVASDSLGCNYTLSAEGYNPMVSSPLDVSLVPRTRWTLLSAALSQTGRYSRDALRCACSTQVRFGMDGEQPTISALRLGTTLSPLLMFLTDNVRSFRGSGARRCPRMVRSVIWDEVDPARCGIIPGILDPDFTLESYLAWLEGVQPIMITGEDGTVSSTGKVTLGELMDKQYLSGKQCRGMLEMVHPTVRLRRGVELLQCDSLHPRLACAYAAFVKGIFCNDDALEAARKCLGSITENDLEILTYELRTKGWDANAYGRSVAEVTQRLLGIAREGLTDSDEQDLLQALSELWEFNMVPREAFVHQEAKAVRPW